MKFQINNTFRLYKFGTVLGYVMAVFILVLVLSLRFFPDYFGFMFGIVWIIVFIYSVSYVILIRKSHSRGVFCEYIVKMTVIAVIKKQER